MCETGIYTLSFFGRSALRRVYILRNAAEGINLSNMEYFGKPHVQVRLLADFKARGRLQELVDEQLFQIPGFFKFSY